MNKFKVILYENENGECPVEEFMPTLEIKMRAKMIGLLEILEEKGNTLREPYSEYLSFAANKVMTLQDCCIFSIMRER